MLERIRKALGHSPGPEAAPPKVELPELGEVLPAIGSDEKLPKFEAELAKVDGVTYRASTCNELEGIIRNILESSGATNVVLSRNPLLAQLGLAAKLREWGKSVAVWPSQPIEEIASDEGLREFAAASFSATVGITGVDFVLAESGTLVLSSLTEGSQLVSLAPPVHVALYRRKQVVAFLEEVLENLPIPLDPSAPQPGRSVVFVTGPSRTADIEQILIRGVHGPREVHAILVEESASM